MKNTNFGQALEELKAGHKCYRKGWNGKGIFIELQKPDENSKMTGPYIFIDTTGLQTDNESAPKSRVPWLASQTDMLAEDWCSDRVYWSECGACIGPNNIKHTGFVQRQSDCTTKRIVYIVRNNLPESATDRRFQIATGLQNVTAVMLDNQPA